MLNKLFSLFLLTLGWSVISAYAQITPEPQNLESGQLIERQLAGGESHISNQPDSGAIHARRGRAKRD